ncbi:PTS galactitol transporter subunit IIB [Pectinatus brassicae]|uniref:PTS system galactitol-specific IIB component n=1 Tax=Pectinatus brassicae TaxID=862415 RepID=A0A840USM1_9FIRM|nr:PTS galactitol transporter subunit IIB [Pectinatus brassicae]MBB5335515.1 PTS system galactitol-specific IIB component [Pectinatus brassicae]
MKKIIVACGGAVATSTVAATAIKELCQKNNIPVEILQIRMTEIEGNLEGVDLIVTTMRIKKDFGKPYVNGMPFLSGLNVEKTEQAILSVLQG